MSIKTTTTDKLLTQIHYSEKKGLVTDKEIYRKGGNLPKKSFSYNKLNANWGKEIWWKEYKNYVNSRDGATRFPHTHILEKMSSGGEEEKKSVDNV